MQKRALVIEDQRHIARLIQVNLERQGYHVELAWSLGQARSAIEARRPDLIVLNVLIQTSDCFDLLRELKRDSVTRDVPVMLLSPTGQQADVFRGWNIPGMPDIRWYTENDDEPDDEDDNKPQ
jgi:two-component system, OmpR family, alkaline phosphatase synthesis response regulator PhoP